MATVSPFQQLTDTDFELSSQESTSSDSREENSFWQNIRYLLAGTLFGIFLIKAEVVSWYRIQEMFRFQSFHMYGVIGSAIVVGAFSVWLLKKFGVKTITGEPIQIQKRKFHKGTIIGGLLFGFGWALTGACPGPLFALIGNGSYVFAVSLLSAIAGTWVYGSIRDKLLH